MLAHCRARRNYSVPGLRLKPRPRESRHGEPPARQAQAIRFPSIVLPARSFLRPPEAGAVTRGIRQTLRSVVMQMLSNAFRFPGLSGNPPGEERKAPLLRRAAVRPGLSA